MRQIPLIDNIKIDEKTGCWIFLGTKYQGGYGQVCFMGRKIGAHRLSAHLWLGFDLNDRRCVLHRCDNPPCVNPKHLFIGTHKDNIQDSIAKGRFFKSIQTHCKRGHLLFGSNLQPYGIRHGIRRCLMCIKEYRKKYV